ncbi:hypothetical protein V8G54_022376 [Vigna mungo]|uniref:Uncharacterized protein n=1 Tax=Vigna mungo TaxID=3915 RepID=A0AAQ3NEZ2_VIGMU
MTPLLLRMRFTWFSAGCRMLNSTHAKAGTTGSNSASPRLSPSAIWAICDAAKAASQYPRVEKTAPAIAVPAMEDVVADKVALTVEVRPFGRLRWEKRERVGFEGGSWSFRLLVFTMAMVAAMVAAIVKLRRLLTPNNTLVWNMMGE